MFGKGISKVKDNETINVKDKKIEKILTTTLIVVGIVLLFELFFITYYLGIYKYIYKGVCVDDIQLGGLTRKEAITLLSEKYDAKLDSKKIKFTYKDYSKEVSLKEIISDIDYASIALEARQVGREGSLLSRFYTVVRLRKEKMNINPSYTIDITELRKKVYEIKSELDCEKEDAIIKKEIDKDFEITPEKVGINVLIDETIDSVKRDIESGDLKDEIQIIVHEDIPDITVGYANSFSTLLGEYRTSCKGSAYGRLENLKNGSKKINGTILMPDEVFSFNNTISPVDAANGYKNAGVIYNGTLTEGMGGGICQLSSTLYNAVLFSELEVTERRNHSLTVAYVPLARDAVVSIGTLDFKFKNSTNLPLYIESYVSNGEVVMKIYGASGYKKYDKIELENKVIKTIPVLDDVIAYDESLAPYERIVDSKGVKGYVVELYRKCYKNDELIVEELVNTSRYSATGARVRVAPGV